MADKKKPAPKARPKKAPKAVVKKTAEQRIASGEVDADGLVKWGDLKNLK